MWLATVPTPSGWLMQRLDGAGQLQGEPWLAAAPVPPVGHDARDDDPSDPARVVWSSTAALYPGLLDRGVRVDRCHDLDVVEALLTRGSSLAAALPADVTGAADDPALFELPGPEAAGAGSQPGTDGAATDGAPAGPPASVALGAVAARFAAQRAGIAERRAGRPGFGVLVAAESACTLAAAEMTRAGLPWSAAVHDRLLETELGPRPRHGGRPARMQELAEELAGRLQAPGLNPDSQPDLLRALHRAGIPVRTTRAHELRRVQHPAIAPLLRYRELSRLFTANGWAWRDQWAPDGRFRPEYVPAGVVSGRWASRGGGALQIPKPLREAVVADPGRTLVVADAGQLEPRVLAALSGDRAMLALARSSPDLYTAVALDLFGRDRPAEDLAAHRHEVKVAFLAAMYGGGTGSPALAALRRRFPEASALLEDAAGQGETGGLVHSVLGRPCPPPPPDWFDAGGEGPDRASPHARARGRFTRNFLVQASAADWANVLVAVLRRELARLTPPAGSSHGGPAQLVFFVHDEIVVDAPVGLADEVVAALARAEAEATRLVLGAGVPPVPLTARVVRCYADQDTGPADVTDHGTVDATTPAPAADGPGAGVPDTGIRGW